MTVSLNQASSAIQTEEPQRVKMIAPNTRTTQILQILQSLIQPDMYGDPMGLSSEGIKQRRIGKVIDDFRQGGRTLIEASHVPGHVKGVRPGTASYLRMEKGAILYQYVRPLCMDQNGNPAAGYGYIGQYFSLDRNATPDNLGIYDQVLDPGTNQRIQKLHICLQLNETVTTAVRSTAKKIIDTFSIKGEPHVVQGGAQQFFLGIYLNQMASHLTILIPEFLADEQIQRIEDIARRNSVQIKHVPSEEFQKLQENSDQITSRLSEEPETRYPSGNFNDLLPEALKLTQIGKYKQAAELLKQAQTNDQETKDSVSLLLGCLYSVIEDEESSNKHFHIYRESDTSIANTEIHLLSQLISARHTQDTNLALSKLRSLVSLIEKAENLKGPSNSIKRLKILTFIEIGKKLNYLYVSTTPYITTHSDAEGVGEFAENKVDASKQACFFLKRALSLCESSFMHPQEIVHLRNQYAYARYKTGDNQAALEQLLLAEEMLGDFLITIHDVYSPVAIEELQLLQLSIKIRLLLILSKFKKENYPDKYLGLDPQRELIELAKQLGQFDHTLLTLMVEKMLVMDGSDYHIAGWVDNASLRFAGTDFVNVIRGVVPIDWALINPALAKQGSDVKSLEIPFLGLEPPCGMSDAQCGAFLNALRQNTSLQSLVLRKFSVILDENQNGKKVVVHSNTQRIGALLNVLTEAEENGMKLEHFSYDGSRFAQNEAGKADMIQACEFIEKNTSLKSFFPDLYDWTDNALLVRFAEAIKNHPTLEVLYTGIWEKNPDAGKILYDILKDREKPLKIVLHHYDLDPKRNPKAVRNNEWLQKLNEGQNTLPKAWGGTL